MPRGNRTTISVVKKCSGVLRARNISSVVKDFVKKVIRGRGRARNIISAVKKTSGNNPHAYFADNSRYQRPRIHKLSKEIDKVVRSRLLNPKWLEGMKQHGYKGAFEMSASLDYLFSFDATTNLVPNWCYESIASNWLVDEKTRKFINDNNPWALRDIAERLLEASNRKLWTDATNEEIASIKSVLSDIDSKIEKFNSNRRNNKSAP